MLFEEVLPLLRKGARVQRQGWNGKGLWAELQKPDANSKMTLPYFYITYPPKEDGTPGARVPWVPSITDILADDWEISPGEPSRLRVDDLMRGKTDGIRD